MNYVMYCKLRMVIVDTICDVLYVANDRLMKYVTYYTLLWVTEVEICNILYIAHGDNKWSI